MSFVHLRLCGTKQGFVVWSSFKEANMQAPVFWTDLSFLRGGENEACRKSNPNDNSVDYYHVVENIYKLKDCQALLPKHQLGSAGVA